MGKDVEQTKGFDTLKGWDKTGRGRLAIGALVLMGISFLFAFTQAGAQTPKESGYTLDGDSVYWELQSKGRITVSPHTSHGRWDATRYQTVKFESYLGTEEEITCGLAFNERPVDYGLSLQKERIVQYPLYDAETNETIGYENVTESYWQDVTSQLTTGAKAGKFFGYGTFTVPATGKKTFQVRYRLNESDPIVDGKRKWEMRCWQGSFAAPAWEINLDPWADNITCLGYWSMDTNVSGPTSTSNYANCTLGNLTATGGPVYNQLGYLNESWHFGAPGVPTNYLTTTVNTGIDGTEPMTVSMWFKANDSVVGGYLWAMGTWTGNDEMRSIMETNGNIAYNTRPSKYGSNIPFPATTGWRFLTTVYNGTTVLLYENATLKYQYNTGNSTTNNIFVVGQSASADFNRGPYRGFIDEVSIFAEALTADQIMMMYRYGTKSLWGSLSVIEYVKFNASIYSTDDSIGVSALVTDADRDNMTVSFNWTNLTHALYYESFANQPNGTIVNATLGSANTTAGNTINVSVVASTGYAPTENHNITYIASGESAGETSIAAGIAASTASSGTIYTDQQVYIRYLNGTQKLGRFDKVLVEGSQRWLFNYITTGESYTNMGSIAPVIYVWENASLFDAQITAQVSSLINSTNI